MKIKFVLMLSLGVNAVLLITFGYLQTLPVEPLKSPPIVYFVNYPGTGNFGSTLKAIVADTATP